MLPTPGVSRVLVVSPRIPYPPTRGDQIHVFHVVKELSRDHHVTVIAFDRDGVDSTELEKYCSLRRVPRGRAAAVVGAAWAALLGRPAQVGFFSSRRMRRQISAELDGARFDSMHLHLIRMLPYHQSGIPTVLDITDASTLYLDRRVAASTGLLRLFWKLEASRMRRFEQRLTEFERVTVCSDTDRQHLLRHVPAARIDVIENGIDLEHFTRRRPREHNSTLVFSGNMTYAPNADAAAFLVEEVWPHVRRQIPDARLLIAGQAPPPKVQALGDVAGVEVTGFLPDIRDAYEAAELAVAPMRFGAGTPYKVLEPMALEIPVLATATAVAGLPPAGQAAVDVAPHNGTAFADQIVALLGERERQDQLIERGSEFVASLSWAAIGSEVRALHDDLQGKSSSRPHIT
jgi:polysaccharide biosynthesis protein PslH